MATPNPNDIALCLDSTFSDDVPSKPFVVTMSLIFSLAALLYSLNPQGHMVGRSMWFGAIMLVAAMVLTPVIMVIRSSRAKKDRNEVLGKAHRLIAVTSLTANFQMLRTEEGIVLRGVPASTTPELTGAFAEIHVVLSEAQLVAVAPLLEPLRMRFQKLSPKG